MNQKLALYNTQEDLDLAAKSVAGLVEDQFKHATYLYFLARYLVILYEVRFAALPMQVWNEYRNALDHYFRNLTSNDDETKKKHLEKMEGHIQRAVLDICKLLCHTTSDALTKVRASVNQDAIRIVDNGNFETTLQTQFKAAADLFTTAKAQDLDLGSAIVSDREIVSLYVGAVYAFKKAEDLFDSKTVEISKATLNIKGVQHQSSLHHIKDSLIAKAIWVAVIFISGFIGANISNITLATKNILKSFGLEF